MGGVNVKNTMIEGLLQNIAPHLCFGCGKIGLVLCEYCKYDIISEPFCGCIFCGKPQLRRICEDHHSSIANTYIVSKRTGVIKALIDALKFHYTKAAAIAAAELLDHSLPILPNNTVIVPIPTVSSHIRQRGYDQVEVIARHFSRLRSLSVTPLLVRATTATQHTSNRKDRLVQSRTAFSINSALSIDPQTPILILDDVITTGSTVSEAAELLAQRYFTLFVAALAYQPLD